MEDKDKIIKDRDAVMEVKDVRIGPYFICVANGFEVEKIYFIFHEHHYDFDNVIEALGFAFKFFMSLNLEYPYESEQIWLFIQRVVYNIELEGEEIPPHLFTAINLVEKTNKIEKLKI